MSRDVARARITPWPTPVGTAIISAALFTRALTQQHALAIGPLIGLSILIVVDYVLSMWALHQRPVELYATTTRVVLPDQLSVTVEAPTGFGHLRVIAARWSLFDRDSEFVTLRRNEKQQTISLSTILWGRQDYQRVRSDVSVIGLVFARRWSTHATADLCMAVEPTSETVEPMGVDSVGRLRTYVPGDRMGLVSWAATARTGQLHVRAEAVADEEVTVVVDLGIWPTVIDGDIEEKKALAHALRVGESLVDQGRPFRLIAAESTDLVRQQRRDHSFASPRRRRQANLGHSTEHEIFVDGKPASHGVSSIIHDRDELIRRLASADVGEVPRPQGAYIEVTAGGATAVG